MDPLHLTIALVPLAVYLLVLGIINLGRRPFLTTGGRDGMALALGLAGLVIAGPMELFLPEKAAQTFGPFVWLLMIGLYVLTCTLLVLMARPRLVIYNITPTELRPILEQVAKQLDAQASWADDTFVLPSLYVQFHVESFSALRNASLVAVGVRQSWQGWRRLEHELAQALQEARSEVNPYGLTLVASGLIMAAATTWWLASNQHAVITALREMLRL